MRSTEAVAFMLADRQDLARACVAASTFRRFQPNSALQLFVRGALPAPWVDLSASCFDRRVSLHDLPPLVAPGGAFAGASCGTDLTSVMRELCEQGAQRAIYLDHRHVWFNALPPSFSLGCPTALWAAGSDVANALACELNAPMSVHRVERVDRGLGGRTLPPRVKTVPHGAQLETFSNSVVGLTLDDLRYAQLRFDSVGRLHWGSKAVLSTFLSRSGSEQASGSTTDIIWLELEKWYVSQLERFDRRVS